MTPEQLAARVLADLPDYDAGLLNDWGGGNVDWWQDYLRAEIGRANEAWRENALAAIARLFAPGDDLVERLETKAAMIALGEKIAWGSDSAIMQEAAARLSALAAEKADKTKALDLVAETITRAVNAEAEAATLRDRLARMGALAEQLIEMMDWTGTGDSASGDAEREAFEKELTALTDGGTE